MLKTVVLVVAGLVAGLAIASWLQPGATPPAEQPLVVRDASFERRAVTSSTVSAARVAALEEDLAAEVEQRAALETRVAELAAQLEVLAERPARGGASASVAPQSVDPSAARALRARDSTAGSDLGERRFVERLVGAGFAPDRAEWIVRRTEELRMEALQAQYDAQRDGRAFAPSAGDRALRAELGDADYERFLAASGRPTTIAVRDVLASSPAERSGLKAGDEILAYNGTRVFDMRELNELTLAGVPGESVVVDVRREGQNTQLVIPRGPIGITAGGFRGR